jgi:hypothetical protein
MGFSAAGFFGQVNANMTDKRQYIRARVDEDRLYLREQGLKRQAGIQEQRGQYEQAARSLTNRGADERRVLNFLESNPSGLMELYRRTDNDNNVTGANLNDAMVISEDYKSEATMDEVLNSILPTIQAMPNDTGPVESRRRSIASWLGLDVDEAMTNQVYNQQIVGGMTGDQIMSSMNLPIQAEGSNDTSATLNLDFLRSSSNLSANDVSTHIRTINEELSIDGEVARLNQLINPEAGLPRPTTEETTDYMADIAALEEADSRSGANRINALLAIPGVEPGATTRMLIGLHGENLFSNTNGFNNPSLSILLGTSSEDTSDAAVAASGDPAVVVPEAQAPTGSALRPQARPGTEAKIASTTAEIEESARTALEVDPELQVVSVPTTNGTTIDITREELPLLSLEESEDRAAFLTALRSGEPNIDEAIYAYMDKYGMDKTRAVQRMSEDPVAPSGRPEVTPRPQATTAPAAPAAVPEIPVEEAIADQQMLQAAVTSTDIEQDELDTIMQNFIDKYGLEAARNVVSQTQNPG